MKSARRSECRLNQESPETTEKWEQRDRDDGNSTGFSEDYSRRTAQLDEGRGGARRERTRT